MNIHLLRSPELKEETYRNVLHVLQRFRGPMNFIASEEEILLDSESEEVIWKNKEDFERKEDMPHFYMPAEPLVAYVSENIFPITEKVKTWKELFAECESYRKQKGIPENDIVMLLTDVSNESNWFGGVSPSMTNYFVQTSNWHYFFGSSIDIRFPIAYEITIWMMRYFMFSTQGDILNHVHQNPVGCIMDYCADKSQIVLKMRTADLCEDCMQIFIVKDVPKLYAVQCFEILDGIREAMTFRGRAKLFHKPSRLEIKGYLKKIFFSDLGNLELRLNPKEKTVYLLFLNHPKGIHLNALTDHKEELTRLYQRLSNQTNCDAITRAIDLLVNPLENDINIVLSRINRKIKDAVGDSLQDFYSIRGDRGEKKRIKLDRELVVYSDG